MPTYEFQCNDTGKVFEVSYRSVADYDPEAVVSPYTGSTNVTRVINRVSIMRGGISLEAMMNGDEDAITALENADPMTLGASLRAMADETGEDMGAEFNDIVDRLASGQSPAEIEANLPEDAT